MRGKLSLNQVRMAIDTADSPTAQTKAKAIHDKSLAASREIESPWHDRIEKTLCVEEEVR
jgi:hypothetical protein